MYISNNYKCNLYKLYYYVYILFVRGAVDYTMMAL